MDPRLALQRLEYLKGQRALFDSQWQEIKDRMLPHAADFTVERSQGSKTTSEMYDGRAAIALERFGAVMESLLTPRQQRWHRLKSSNDDLNKRDEVREWFDLVTRKLFEMREVPRADFYGQSHEGYKSLGAFGNRCLYVDEAPFGLRYSNCHVGSVWIALDQYRRINTVYHTRKMSAMAAFERWGDKTPEKIRASIAISPYERFEFLHIVQPRKNVDSDRLDALGMPYESYELCVDTAEMITTGGYREMPYVYSRYTVNSAEDYGRGPANQVLPNVKGLNSYKRSMLRAGEIAAEPPLLLADDGVFGWQSRQVTLTPRGLNYGGLSPSGTPMIAPLVSGAQLEVSKDLLEDDSNQVNDAFLVSLFQILVENPGMTATEVLQRANEKGMLIAPAVGRQQTEMLGPMIEREIRVLWRSGVLPPPPRILVEAEGDYKIEYESPATRFQRSEELLGLQRTMEIFAPVIQLQPSLIENIEWDEAIRDGLQINGVPASWIRTKEQLDRVREQQAQEAERQQQLEQAPVVARAAKDAAQAQAALPPEARP